MPDNRSNHRNTGARNDNDAFGGSSRSGRGGSWSNRDDDDLLNRNAGSGRSRSDYDSDLNDRMERGGSYTSAYGNEQSTSADRYRGSPGGNRDRDMSDRVDRDRNMGADSWGGGADRDTGRDRYNRQERSSAAGSYSDRDNDRGDERNDYYGNRSMGESGRGDRYTGRDGGSNQFSAWRNEPSDMSADSRAGAQSGMQRGQHAGRGPKGYRRDDARITEDLNEALTRDAHIDASEIEVSVSGGEVTLSGTVDSRDAKRQAEDMAESISGVHEVNNQIRVSRSGANASSTSDSDSDRLSGRSSSDRSSSMKKFENESEQHSDKNAANKSGAKEGTSTADGAMSAQGTGPSGAANTATAHTNPVPKSIPSTQGTSSHKTGNKGAQ